MTMETKQLKPPEIQWKQCRGNFIEKHQINNLTLHLKQLEKEEQKKSKVSWRKEIIKINAEINEKEMKEIIAKIN